MKSLFASLFLFLSSLVAPNEPAVVATHKVALDRKVPAAPSMVQSVVHTYEKETKKDGITVKSSSPYVLANSQTKLEITGGLSPYMYQVTAGGMYTHKLNKEDIYYKAPAVAGPVAITVTDSKKLQGTVSLVVVPILTVSFPTESMMTSQKTKLSVLGGLEPYTYSIKGEGDVTKDGIVTRKTAGRVTVLVEDASGQEGAASLTVNDAQIVATTPTVPNQSPIGNPVTPPTGTPPVVAVPTKPGIKGKCGVANWATMEHVPSASDLCEVGNATAMTGSGPWSWSCEGLDGGVSAACRTEVAFIPIPVEGTCGAANGSTIAEQPTEYLCIGGLVTSMSEGAATWSWRCEGVNGGGSHDCQANKP